MSKPTKYYRVEVAQTVEAYASVTVQARSAKEAERIVKGFIKRDGYVDAVFRPEWDTAENLRIVEGCVEETDPAIARAHKNRVEDLEKQIAGYHQAIEELTHPSSLTNPTNNQ